MPQHIKFESEPGASRSQWIALALLLIIIGWMASGIIFPHQDASDAPAESPSETAKIMTVAVKNSTAMPVVETLIAEGQTIAEKTISIRPETGGTIAEVMVRKGQNVTEGQTIARIDAAQRSADLKRTEAELARAQREFDNAQELRTRGVATNDRVTSAQSALAAAQSGVANAEAAMNNLNIIAPVSGVLEGFTLQSSEFISPGMDLGRIVVLNPLTIKIDVPQSSISNIELDQLAQIEFITGERASGSISYISSVADSQTRTFVAEITIDNPNASIPAGISAEVFIPTGERTGHFLTPAILSLNTSGILGVKAIGSGNTVTFYPVEIIRAELDGVWVSGLPETLDIITIGQGFVSAGELVNPKPEAVLEALNAQAKTGGEIEQ